jgi:hypothetical protein
MFESIVELEKHLKDEYNVVCAKEKNQSDEEYISCLMKEIIEEEDKRILSIIEEILRG